LASAQLLLRHQGKFLIPSLLSLPSNLANRSQIRGRGAELPETCRNLKCIPKYRATSFCDRGFCRLRGNPKYFFAKRDDGDLVESIPSGYEIYENPNAQVFLRRKRPQIIKDEEVAVVREGVKQYSSLAYAIIDVKKDAIIIYTADQDVDLLAETFGTLTGASESKVRSVVERILSYSPMMQFVLSDKEQRLFEAWRFSFLGSIDDWIPISGEDTLPALVKRYVKHLGEDSFYELY
jgi:hypothetical protein